MPILDVMTTEDEQLIKIKDNRWKASASIWDQMQKDYKRFLQIWKNLPEWLNEVPATRSKVRDNRIFLSIESILNKVTGRPTKPNVLPGNSTDDAQRIAEGLQKLFLSRYKELNVKKTLKRGLRYLFFTKLITLKVFWDREIDDFNVKPVDPKKVRFSKNATSEKESEVAIEEIEKPILTLLAEFPDKQEDILKEQGITLAQAQEINPDVKWYEVWLGNGVFWNFKSKVLDKRKNPYWDWKGLRVTRQEAMQLEKKMGARRRPLMRKIKNAQGEREQKAVEGQEFEAYLYNHFDTPRKPYIFGTVLEVEDSPVGATSLIEQGLPLQEGIDKRKRQIDDNADTVNGITKVDTEKANITLADARKIHYDTGGLVYGPGVGTGVTREFGTALPAFVFNDMEHSIRELDNIMGTQQTFRGEGSAQETATGRAILREEGFSRLDELISLVDYIGYELYNWWMQMTKVRYTESHLIKPLGDEKAEEVMDIMQDDIHDGMEVNIIAGQVLPEDRLYKAERVAEDVKAGLVDPLTYFKVSGSYDNPEEVAKRFIMFKQNPLSIVNFDESDIEKIRAANQMLAMMQGAMGGIQEGGGAPDERASKISALRTRMEEVTQSPEFQKLPPDQQMQAIRQLRQQLKV